MNRDYIITLLEAEKPNQTLLIQPGDFIDYELILKLREIGANNAMNYFAKVDQKEIGYTNRIEYNVEVPCQNCGEMSIVKYNKTNLRHFCFTVKTMPYCVCDDCKEKRKIEDQKWIAAQKIKDKEDKQRRYKEYMNYAFNPEYNNNGVEVDLLGSQFFNDQIQQKILSMNYKDFLKTRYWEQVRKAKVKRAGYCCELCGRKGLLHVHHKTYENHGLEHLWDVRNNDLIVLCKDCHEKFHDIHSNNKH